MSEPIRVGDLVVIVKSGCTEANLGFLFTVSAIACDNEDPRCVKCGKLHGNGRLMLPDRPFPSGSGIYIAESRLRRIPPLSELESSERKQEIEA